MRPGAALLLALGLAGCAATPPSPRAFTFAVVGDTPYSAAEERLWLELVDRVNAAGVDFTVHVGDFKGSGPCSDELFARRRAQFDTFAHPLVYTPGDNEWTDCRRPDMGSMDPLERLARLRTVFFAGDESLGARPMPLLVQAGYRENRAWTFREVRFVTVNVPGSDNNVGFDAASDAEALRRNEANRRWLAQAFDFAQDPGIRALVVAFQANPWSGRRAGVYDGLLAQLAAQTERLGKPVLVVHGDTHTWRVDHPWRDATGAERRWPRRLETYGSPFTGWVAVTVDPARPDPFSFAPKPVGTALPH